MESPITIFEVEGEGSHPCVMHEDISRTKTHSAVHIVIKIEIIVPFSLSIIKFVLLRTINSLGFEWI